MQNQLIPQSMLLSAYTALPPHSLYLVLPYVSLHMDTFLWNIEKVLNFYTTQFVLPNTSLDYLSSRGSQGG